MRIVIAVATVLVAVATARADRAAGDRAAAEAVARADAKDFIGAAAKYREAYAADPRPEHICNVGVAYYKAQDLSRAQLFLSRCLERGSSLEAAFIDTVRATLAKLERSLHTSGYTPVDIVVEPRFATVSVASFAPDETFDGSRTLWLRFGSDKITVHAEGYVDQTVVVSPSDQRTLAVHVALAKQPPPPIVHEPVVTPPFRSPPQIDTRAAIMPPHHSVIPLVIASGVTVACTAIAVFAAGKARDHADRAGLALRGDAFHSEADSAHTWNAIFAIDAALAAASAGTSGYLLFSGKF